MKVIKIRQKTTRVLRRVRLRTWIAFGFILIVLPIVAFKLLFKESVSAAALTATEDSTSITITSPGHYRVVIQKGDTDDYMVFYDLAEDANNPDPTHEFKGPCILETSTFCLRDDASRVTNLIEVTDTVVKVRVMGRFNNEASTDYLDDDTPVYFPDVVENYAFTRDGVSVRNRTDFALGAGVTFDADSGHNGYEWLGVYTDVTDAAFDDTANVIYGDGATASTISADGEFANTNAYVVLPGTGTSTYQDAFIGIHKDGWYSDRNTSGTQEWNWDESESGNQDMIAAQEQNYNSARRHDAKWYFLLKNESDLDTEAEREALNNEMLNADTLSYTTGETSYEIPITSTAVNFDADEDYVYVADNSAYDFGDTEDFTVEAWMLRNGNPVSGDNPIVGKRLCCGAGGWDFQIRLSSARMRLQLSDGSDTYDLEGSTVLSDNTWYHVAVVFDQDNASNSVIYVNGVAETMTRTGTIGNLGSLSNSAGLGFGIVEPNAGNYNSFSGRIAEVRIWNDVRTAAEIRDNMYRQIDPASSNLVGYWKLDEGTGTAVHDESATGANGTIVGGATWDSVNERKADRFNEFEFASTLQTTAQNAQYDIDANSSNVSTTANGAVSDNATTITVTSTTGFSSTGVAYIDGDKFSYSGVTSTTFTGVPSSGELAVIEHATGTVVSQFKRNNTNFKIAGYQSTQKPEQITREGVKLKEGSDFTASVKPVTEGYFAQDLSFYSDFSSTTVDVGSNLTNSGASLLQGGNDYPLGFLGYFADSNADITFTSTSNIDYAKGALEFMMNPLSASSDNTERTYFDITDGTDQFRFRKTSGNTLEFLIDEGATTYTESITSSNYSWGVLDTVHIRLEWDDTAAAGDQLKIYINGTERTRTDSTGDFTGSLVAPGTTFRLGNSAASGGLFCNCIIDEFKIYDFNGSGNQIGLNKAGAGGVATDYFSNPGNNLTLSFAAVDASNRGEYLYLGSDSKVNGFNFELLTNGVGSSLNLDWEYWNGSTWTSLESITGFTDTTNNLTQSGSVYWTAAPTNWRVYTMNSRNELYYIRASLNASSGSYTTSPVENRITTSTLYIRNESTLENEDLTFVVPTQFAPSAYWKMDEGQGTTLNDSSGNKNEGTRTNAAWQSDEFCPSGNCLFFDGTGDYVSRSNDDSFNFTASESFSMSAWIRHGQIATNPDVIVAKHNGTAGGYKIRMENDGDISCGIDDDSTYSPDAEAVSTAATYDDNRWHHIECVKDGTSSISLYIDGVLITTNSSISGVGSLVNTNTFYVGIDGDGSSNGFEGYIDEFKMYPYARTAAEVKADATVGSSNRGSAAVFGAQDTALSQGLVGYWKFDESSGNASDASGNNTTLTNNSTTPYSGSKFGNSGEMDGSTDYFEAADNANLSLTGDVTLAAWINNDDTSGSQNIIGKWDGTNNSYLLALEGDELRMYIDSSSNYQTTTVTNLSSNSFVHVAGVYSASTQTVRLFVNGVEQTSTTTGTIPSSIGDDAGEIVVGADDSPTNYFDGHIDDARIYNRALSNPEVRRLSEWVPGPSGWWKLDEGSGTTAADSSGNGNNATLNNMEESDKVTGKYGNGIVIDSGEYANVDSDTGLRISGGITMTAWVKRTSGDSIIVSDNGSQDNYGMFASGNQVQFGYTSGGSAVTHRYTTTASVLSSTEWKHIAISYTFGSASSMKIYVNGILEPGSWTSGTGTGSPPDGYDDTNQTLYFGFLNLDGALDDVKIYNYARTSGQIVEDMNGDHPLGGSPLGSQVINWKFDEGYGTTANNQVSGGTSGTLTSMTLTPSTSTTGWTNSGKYNKALVFDGSDDKVEIATASDANVDFNGSEQFSACAWVYSTTMAGSSERDAIITKWDATTPTRGYRLTLTNDDGDSTGNFRAEVYDESTDQTLSASGNNDSVSENTWYHVCTTFNGGVAGAAGDLILYVNGQTPVTNAANASFLGLEDVTADFTVGDYDATDVVAADTAFTGRIDDVQVYGGLLTEDQVKIVMNANASINISTGSTEDSGNAPVGYWDLNENTGTSAFDRSGNGNTGTLTNNPSWATGKIGAGVRFNGNTSNQYIQIADADVLSPAVTDQYTIQAWFKQNSDTVDRDWIVSKGNTSNYEYGIAVYNGTMYCESWNSAGDSIAQINAGSVSLGAWHFVACTMNDTTGMVLYLDGVPVGTSAGLAGAMSNTSSVVQIGNRADGGDNNFDGIIDDVKMYNYERNLAQLAYDYNRGAPPVLYKFDECTGSTAYNNTQNANGEAGGNNGTITIGSSGSNTSTGNCTTVNTATSWYNGRTGKFNTAVSLDGTDDYVEVTDTSSLRFDSAGQDFSLFAWIKRTTTGEMNIISKEDADNDGWRLQINSSNQVLCSEDSTDITSTSTITDTNWHLVGCTIDRDGNGQAYIDGMPNGATVSMGTDAMATTSNIRIGTRSYSSTNYFSGLLDSVSIYNYVVSATQAKRIFNEDAGARFGPTEGQP